ncbi:MAG: 5-formyltetrahydrofolate cyclo-ligase [Candidatus Woesearchaeota archaeon]
MKSIYSAKKEPMRLACMLSGSGTNVRKIIERQLKLGEGSPFRVVAIFTDNKNSNAVNIAAENVIPFLCNDIKDYYEKRNADRKDLNVRREYDAETKKFLCQHKADAVALCGYMSIVTAEITDSFVTVNIHPADLRKKGKNGRRLYAGMLGVPSVQAAIMNGDSSLRSSVHLVTSGLDEGPILVVSAPVKVKVSEEEKKNPMLLKEAAERNMEALKEKGDWAIYPEAIEMLARGKFGIEGTDIFVDGTRYDNGYCPSDEKEAIRQAMKEKRRRIPDVTEKSAAITKNLLALSEFQAAKRVMFYCALPNEAQTKEAIKEANALGKKVLLPVTRQSQIIVRGFTGFENLKPGAYGILEPTSADAVDEKIDLVFVPGLAFDKNGTRIGFGLGCYDEFLKLTNGKKAGLCFEEQLFDRLPRENKDVPMDIIITEQRVINVEKG